MKQPFLILLLYFAFSPSFSQEDKKSQFQKQEDTLGLIQKKLFSAKNNEERLKFNNLFVSTLERTLQIENSFEFPFDSLNQIARLSSPDKKFRIFNWDFPKDDGTFEYYGFIQVYDKKSKKYMLFKLMDKSEVTKNPENYSSDNKKWFGMLYYKVIQKKYKKSTYYVLLGFDGNDKVSRKKIIDVLKFNNNNVPQFGDAIFKMEKKTVKRVMFEYNSDVVMSVKYNENEDMIVFDHLAPPNSGLIGQYQFYGPDFSYDALKYSKGKWTYIPDVDARNNKDYKDPHYNDPKK